MTRLTDAGGVAAHRYRGVVGTVTGTEPRPLWSVMIPTYNCTKLLHDALASVLAQDMGADAMQIEVVDDHSTTDDPAELVKEMGKGRVGFFRQPENRGVAGNLNTCLQRSKGRLVHVLHGDDMVRDGFYHRIQSIFERHPNAGAAFCRQIFIDRAGRWLSISSLEQEESGPYRDCIRRLATEQRITTPSIVVRREVYEQLGGFDGRLICSEDWEMWVRIAAHFPFAYEVEPLALYRMHDDSNTGRHVRTGEDMRYTRLAIDIFEKHLSPEIARSVVATARATYAKTALRTADLMFRGGDVPGAAAQLTEALKLRPSACVIWGALRLVALNIATIGAAMLGGQPTLSRPSSH